MADPVDALVADLRAAGFKPMVVDGQLLLRSPDGSPLPHGTWIDAELGKRLDHHRKALRLRIGAA